MLLPVETALEGWTAELPVKAFPPSGWMVRAVGISSPSAASHVKPCTPSNGPHLARPKSNLGTLQQGMCLTMECHVWALERKEESIGLH